MGKPIRQVSREQLEELYVRTNKSGLEVARILGIGRTTLSRKLKLYGIPEKKIAEVMRGRKLSPEHREKVIQTLKYGQKRGSNPNWRGGESITTNGYRLIRVGATYIKEHRLAMEKELGRKLKRVEEVHHVNGDKLDNSPMNLILLSKSHHSRLHWDRAKRDNQSTKMKAHFENGDVLNWVKRVEDK